MKKYLLGFTAAILLSATASPALAAQEDMQLASQVLVERVSQGADGKEVRKLEVPKTVSPGEVLVIEISYKNAGGEPATDFVVTNPLPQAVAFEGGETPGADFSVDGGQSWGALASLTVKQADGTSRAAQSADVTHIRWALKQPVPAGAEGKLSFRGKLR